jgi:hypothetical protein
MPSGLDHDLDTHLDRTIGGDRQTSQKWLIYGIHFSLYSCRRWFMFDYSVA